MPDFIKSCPKSPCEYCDQSPSADVIGTIIRQQSLQTQAKPHGGVGDCAGQHLIVFTGLFDMWDLLQKWYSKQVFPYLEILATSALHRERQRLLASAEGHLIEIGAGAGQNVAHLPPTVKRYVALEPSGTFIKRLRKERLRRKGAFDYLVVQGKAEAIPHPSDLFDTVVSFLVLCSVNDPVASLSEIFRILKPGGRLIFFEHVLAENPEIFRKQYFFNPLWKRIACGCELVRNTQQAIESVGFEYQQLNRYRSSHMGLPITSQVIEGLAIKPFHYHSKEFFKVAG